jgi:hypothetical protein
MFVMGMLAGVFIGANVGLVAAAFCIATRREPLAAEIEPIVRERPALRLVKTS